MTDRNRGSIWIGTLLAGMLLLAVSGGRAQADDAAPPAAAPAPASADWPQYRGPNRDNVAVNCPKLLDAWPKDGPPLAWKSEWIPGWFQGGCSGPVVADGKVFVYSTWHHPVGGGNLYKIITPEVLAYWGWMADLPEDLATKIEAARTAKGRPGAPGWYWWTSNLKDRWAWMPGDFKDFKERLKEVDAYLAKKPELDKYIKDFLATLNPQDAAKYGDFIKNRFCTGDNGFTWDQLGKLSKLEGIGYATLGEWHAKIQKIAGINTITDHHFHLMNAPVVSAWQNSYTRTDTLVCLDAATGKTLWKKDFPLDSEAFSNLDALNSAETLGVVATPAVWNGKCYFAGAAGLYCVSVKDGAKIWQVKCKAEHASPLVADGVVYHGGSAYTAETGQLLWKTSIPGMSSGHYFYGPSYVVFGGKTYIFAGDGNNTLYCLDLQTGTSIWTLKCPNSWTAEVQVSGDVLIAQGKMYKMSATGPQPVKGVADIPGMYFGLSWIIYQDHLYQYMFKGEGASRNSQTDKYNGLCCLDLKSGDLKWSYKGPACTYDTDYAPAILADGKIITVFVWSMWQESQYGVAMYQATPEKYALLGSFKPGLIPWTPMAFAGGKLFLRTELGISCYDLVQHGIYLDGKTVKKDAITFRFKETGGGLVAKDSSSGVMITDAKGAAAPAKATIAGDTLTVDIKDVPAPFGISCGDANALAGKNGKPVPAFDWNEARVLKCRTSFGNTIVLTSDLLLPQNGTWNNAATYSMPGAAVTNAMIDPRDGKTVTLTTDKALKAGDAITLTYPRFHVDQGEAVRELLTFTARESPAARFVKSDEATSGNWKGVYGSEGAVIVGDATANTKCAIVTPSRCGTGVWAGATNDVRALQKWGEAKDRIAAKWAGGWEPYIQIDVEITDGKEHQVALYCLDWDKNNGNKEGRIMKVEAWDPWRNVALMDEQTVTEFTNGKYLVLNLKGHVALHLKINNGGFDNATVSGVFFDPPAPTGK